MSNTFPYTFSLSRWSRAGECYEVLGKDFDSLILENDVVVSGVDALLDVDSLLSGQGVIVESFVDRVGPEARKITYIITLNDEKALPVGVVWFDSDFVSCGGDSRGNRQKMVTWISMIDGLVEERVEVL